MTAGEVKPTELSALKESASTQIRLISQDLCRKAEGLLAADYDKRLAVEYTTRIAELQDIYTEYHLLPHAKHVERAAVSYISYLLQLPVKSREAHDPLKVISSLNQWNQQHLTSFTLVDLAHIVAAFAMTHDVGNSFLPRLITRNQQPMYYPRKRDTLTAKDAENNSVLYVKTTLSQIQSKRKLEKVTIEQYYELIEQLIRKTEFQADGLDETRRDEPFALFAATVDQIGGNIFASPERYGIAAAPHDRIPEIRSQSFLQDWETVVIGLLCEAVAEAEDPRTVKRNPRHFFNFVQRRLPLLLPDGNDREQLLTIWRAALPSQETVTVAGVYLEDKPVVIIDLLIKINEAAKKTIKISAGSLAQIRHVLEGR